MSFPTKAFFVKCLQHGVGRYLLLQTETAVEDEDEEEPGEGGNSGGLFSITPQARRVI